MAAVFSTIPTLMMWDDHDIFDGWGSYDAELQNCAVYQGIFAAARDAFRLFQLQCAPNERVPGAVGIDDFSFCYEVNDTAVWTSETDGRTDLAWTFAALDISTIADGASAVKIRFELKADATGNRGGWTLDDLLVGDVSLGGTTPGLPGDAQSLNGGCKCNVASDAAALPGVGTMLAGLGAIVAACVRRRRA